MIRLGLISPQGVSTRGNSERPSRKGRQTLVVNTTGVGGEMGLSTRVFSGYASSQDTFHAESFIAARHQQQSQQRGNETSSNPAATESPESNGGETSKETSQRLYQEFRSRILRKIAAAYLHQASGQVGGNQSSILKSAYLDSNRYIRQILADFQGNELPNEAQSALQAIQGLQQVILMNLRSWQA